MIDAACVSVCKVTKPIIHSGRPIAKRCSLPEPATIGQCSDIFQRGLYVLLLELSAFSVREINLESVSEIWRLAGRWCYCDNARRQGGLGGRIACKDSNEGQCLYRRKSDEHGATLVSDWNNDFRSFPSSVLQDQMSYGNSSRKTSKRIYARTIPSITGSLHLTTQGPVSMKEDEESYNRRETPLLLNWMHQLYHRYNSPRNGKPKKAGGSNQPASGKRHSTLEGR